jgi:hypothetical protein
MFCKRSNDDKTTAKISEALKHSTVTLSPYRQRRKMPVNFEPESNQKKHRSRQVGQVNAMVCFLVSWVIDQ